VREESVGGWRRGLKSAVKLEELGEEGQDKGERNLADS
jgi:hypothetical protein